MGIGASELDRVGLSDAEWLVPHSDPGSAWARFALRRYSGVAATGMAANAAVPRLLRQRLQDWLVLGLRVFLGETFISFGRQLRSISQPESQLFYGVDLRFDESSSWWYCPSQEWSLRFHKACLESCHDSRWEGQPHWLGEPREGEAPRAPEQCHQLILVLSNADGHPGLLCLPVSSPEPVLAVMGRWRESALHWAGRLWESADDFTQLRETALNLTDILLLGLEPDFAMALTPDWTWEKYPRGLGEVPEAGTGAPDFADSPHETDLHAGS